MFLLSQAEESADLAAGAAGLTDPPDPMSAATLVARGVLQASVQMAAKMRHSYGIKAFAVRVTLDPENVRYTVLLSLILLIKFTFFFASQAHYEAGSGGSLLASLAFEAMNMLDSALVPIVHGPELANRRLAMELNFHILPC